MRLAEDLVPRVMEVVRFVVTPLLAVFTGRTLRPVWACGIDARVHAVCFGVWGMIHRIWACVLLAAAHSGQGFEPAVCVRHALCTRHRLCVYAPFTQGASPHLACCCAGAAMYVRFWGIHVVPEADRNALRHHPGALPPYSALLVLLWAFAAGTWYARAHTGREEPPV